MKRRLAATPIDNVITKIGPRNASLLSPIMSTSERPFVRLERAPHFAERTHMARESLASKRERAQAIEERMFDHYGPGQASLDYGTPFELTVAVVLSAQCTDAAVNKRCV